MGNPRGPRKQGGEAHLKGEKESRHMRKAETLPWREAFYALVVLCVLM